MGQLFSPLAATVVKVTSVALVAPIASAHDQVETDLRPAAPPQPRLFGLGSRGSIVSERGVDRSGG